MNDPAIAKISVCPGQPQNESGSRFLYLNYYTWQDADGHWRRSRTVTIAIYMRDENQIAKFGESIDAKLAQLHRILPPDLITVHTSDQPVQVKENIHLFLRALNEAIILVVIVSLIGFWEGRLALIMALAIPITLAMTFGVVYMMGIDLQQVSVATLIIALGLLVDVPVVSGDRIKRGLADGLPRSVAAWLGPTKLATAIFFATITNVIAYLPFLMLTGNTGQFLRSLPIVMTASLLCALVVSMTFIPLLGYYIQRPPKKKNSVLRRSESGALRLLQQARWSRDRSPLERPARIPGISDRWRLRGFPSQTTVLSGRRSILVLSRRLATQRRPPDGNQRCGRKSRRHRPAGPRRLWRAFTQGKNPT
ncbi:MAG: Multidrug transporter AcrB [Edaphobacter sp.]|nr:Multidrug transporter AcrB [Edaphobacter sp.]